MDKALLARVQKQAWFHRFPIGLPLALLVLGLSLTLYFALLAQQTALHDRSVQLERQTYGFKSDLQRRADQNVAYLVAAASLIKTNPAVTSAEFGDYVSDMSQGASDRGALGLGWAVWADAGKDAESNQLLARLHPGRANLRVRPDNVPSGQSRAIIAMLEPETEANRKAIGYDMRSEPVRRAAIDAAIASHRPYLSGPVRLVQGNGANGVAGALLYVAVAKSKTGAKSRTGEDIHGLVYSPIRVGDFVENALANNAAEFDAVSIYDSKVAPSNLLAQFGKAPSNAIEARETLDFGGRSWIIVAQTDPRSGLLSTASVIVLSGILISLLLMAIAWFITSRAAEDRKVLQWLHTQVDIRTSLTRELSHRVKNTLANVLSIVSLTHRRAKDLDSFVDTLGGRLRALSATHDLLSERDWKDAPIKTIVEREMAPYLDAASAAATYHGPQVSLAPNDALSLGLALHELATNAAKYGALSVVDGRVDITWRMISEDVYELIWSERGGPPVSPPHHRGFGMDLLEKIASRQLGHKIEVDFQPQGATCAIPFPVRIAREFELRARERGDKAPPLS